MKVKLFHEGKLFKEISIPNQHPHPYIIECLGLMFKLHLDSNEYITVPYYNSDNGYLYDNGGHVKAINVIEDNSTYY